MFALRREEFEEIGEKFVSVDIKLGTIAVELNRR
jgi:hypothetical protein